jgi:hypothetical protein
MYQLEIGSLGFTKDEIETISNHFLCNLNFEDWESMSLFDNNEELANYFSIEEHDDESLEDDNCLKLPSGRWVVFTEELMDKEIKAQMD